uniref:Pleckstrin homology domain containing A5 n=1 Tax=Neolamprologus brichardi TaxID=32507 RepID=A0A3Q4G7F1_NEOBR
MAAELQPEWISCLPSSWSYGVTRDGRVFFVNEEAKSTTWLHPVSGEAVITGHRKTPDLPTGWEEGYTFEGARCYINHNERKVTCKHPVSVSCFFLFFLSELPANEKKERPVSTMSEASNYTGGSEQAANPSSPGGRPSRPSKKIHNFGKRSNSIRRNPGAPVIKRNWLYKQDSTGMKLWKKRWFVLSDLCLFYYRDEKEEGILGSILLPSFRISMLSVDDHITRKYAFKATHPNMRTYYFCTDTAKEMESWMKVMTDAALVQSEPVKRLDKLKVEQCGPQEINHVANHRTETEIQKNERNREVDREHAAVSPTTEEEERKQRDAERYGFQKDGADRERPLTKINSIKLQPAQAAAIKANMTSPQPQTEVDGSQHSPQVNGSGEQRPANGTGVPPLQSSPHEPDRSLSRTSSMQQLEQWVRTQRGRGQDDDTRSITSYQTLPRNLPSHRVPYMPHYGDGYCSMPRNSMAQRDSICSMSPSVYDQAMGPSMTEKRRSMRDDTMWQLYEWQQRQAYSRQPGLYSNMASPKTMINLSEHAAPSHSIPPSPSHGSLSMYGGYSPMRSYNMGNTRSEISSPIFRRDMTVERRQRPPYAYLPDRRSMPAGIPIQTITAQSLQGKTPEELTLLLIKLRRQQAELNSIREHTVAQLMQLNMDGDNPKNDILSHHLQRNLMYLDNQMKENEPLIVMTHTLIENSAPRPQLYQQVRPNYREQAYTCMPEEVDTDTKLSMLCEQDKMVRIQEEKLQQLYREKHTLETALLSASQEIELGSDNPAAMQSVVQQRDLLQSGLLSTCREVSRVTAEVERLWREYDRMEGDVTMAKNNLLEQLEALGSPQTEPPSQQHVRIQKELWRIQDVMEALNKHKAQRNALDGMGFYGPKANFSKHKNEEEDSVPPRPPLPQSYEPNPPTVPPMPSHPGVRPSSLHKPEDRKANHRNSTHSGPDYRLYKSEPELTTVAEVDENNGEDRSEYPSDREHVGNKGMSYPVGIVPPRTKSPVPDSSSIASYVTLRKSRKPDPRTERPRSAVEQQLCAVESSRPRMSVEEQLERIRRHQQGTLREKKKSLSIRGSSQENTPSRSHSFTKENHYRNTQVLADDIQELEASLRQQEVVGEQETPAEEIARLKESSQADHFNVDREVRHSTIHSLSTDLICCFVISCVRLCSPCCRFVAVKSLSSSSPPHPQSPTTAPPQLTDGSHFMCV